MSGAIAERRLETVDHDVEELKDAFVDAVQHLRAEDQVDGAFEERLRDAAGRLASLRKSLEPQDYDKDQIVAANDALWALRDLLDEGEPDLDTCDELLINVERLRHVVRDALDEYVTGAREDTRLVLDDLREWLPNASQATIAELAGVSTKTLTRWRKAPREPARRLALVARLVAILRRNWTAEGMIAWFDRPRPELGGRRPRTLLDDVAAEEDLIAAARSGRSQYAS